MKPNRPDPRPSLGLRPIINVSGTMTHLGASIMVDEAVAAMAGIGPEFVEMPDLHRKAGAVVARLCGAEAGTVTACAAAGVALSAAAYMTGADMGRIEQLPDTAGMKNEIVMLAGHMVTFGHPVEQDIRLSGATVRPVGQATSARRWQLEHAITENTAGAFYVVSHHTVQLGMLPLAEFCEICRARGVPVFVDAASEYDLTGFLAAGADLVIYSGHKFIGGPTSGIVAGRADLVRAVYLQNFGIGRCMKLGKESIVGLMAALEAWERRDHAGIRAREQGHLDLFRQTLQGYPGIRAEILHDPTANPLDRVRVHVDPDRAGITAWDLAAALAAGDPPVMVREEWVEHAMFELDPCNLHPGEAAQVAARLVEELDRAKSAPRTATDLARRHRDQQQRLLSFPD